MQGKILFVVINTYAPQYLAQASNPHVVTLVKLAANWRLDDFREPAASVTYALFIACIWPQFPNLASPALMFISDTTPSNAQTVFLEPVDGTVSSDDTVRSESAGWFELHYNRVRIFTTMVPASKLRRLARTLECTRACGHMPAACCSVAKLRNVEGR